MEDECLIASLTYERKYTRDEDLSPSTTVTAHIGLKTGVALRRLAWSAGTNSARKRGKC